MPNIPGRRGSLERPPILRCVWERGSLRGRSCSPLAEEMGRTMAGACDGKVALVTGASRGLGKAIAQRLAGEGATVGLTARTLEPDAKYHGSLQQTLDAITTAGGSAVAIQADLSKSADREQLF